jgi:hypothetical protein
MPKSQDLICKCGKKIEIMVPMYTDKDDNFVCKDCYDKLALAENLLQLDDETFKSAKEIFVNSKIKFLKGPVFDLTLNINIIKMLNTAQLKFLFSLINTELEEREKKEKS